MGIFRHGPHAKSSIRLHSQLNSRVRRGTLRRRAVAPVQAPRVAMLGAELASCLGPILDAEQLPWQAFDTIDEMLSRIEAGLCGCVLVDETGVEVQTEQLQAEIRQRGPSVAIVVCVDRGGVRQAVTAIRSGAFDVLEKPFVSSEALQCIRAALEWGIARSQILADQLDLKNRFSRLSRREQEVMIRLASNQSNKSIATELGISPKTVGVHRSRIMVKMEIDGVVELTKVAHRIGLVE